MFELGPAIAEKSLFSSLLMQFATRRELGLSQTELSKRECLRYATSTDCEQLEEVQKSQVTRSDLLSN